MKKGHLRNLIFITVLTAAILPLLLITFFVIPTDLTLVEEGIYKKIRVKNEATTIAIDAFLRGKVSLLDNFLEVHALHDKQNISVEHEDLYTFVYNNENFVSMAFTDKFGQEIAYFGEYPKFDYIDAIIEASEEGTAIIDKLAVTRNKGLSLVVAMPINTQDSGYVATQVNLTSLSSAFTNIEKDSNILIFNRNGFLIYSSKYGINDGTSKQFADKMTSLIPKAKEDSFIEIESNNEIGVLSVDKLSGWLIYTYTDFSKNKSILIDVYKKYFNRILIALGLIVLLGLLISIYMSSIIISPIKMMTNAVERVGEGETENLPTLPALNNEIGEFSLSFAKMLDSLKMRFEEIKQEKEELAELNQSLEIRVGSRTKELRTALKELIKKERLAAIGQMASIVSHEIKNPLAVIKNSIYLIKARLGSNIDAKLSKNFSVIDQEIVQANGIIEEILGYARTRDQILTTIDLSLYMREVLSSYPMPENIKVTTYFYTDDLPVSIDTEEMKQALRNIIGNAIEVMPEGGMLVIKTKAVGENQASLSITDSGPGIPEELHEKIFTPFFTTKARGTGLGLAVVKKVATRNNAELKLQSSIGKGTKVSFIFNLAKGK